MSPAGRAPPGNRGGGARVGTAFITGARVGAARFGAAFVTAALFVAIAGAASPSCKSDAASADDAGSDVDMRPPTPVEWDRAVTRPAATAAAQSRASCMYQRGALAGETLSADVPIEGDIPITHFVILMQENRSFDHYFGRLAAFANRTDIESPSADAGNPTVHGGDTPSDAGGSDAAGDAGEGGTTFHPLTHAAHPCFLDTNHEWGASHTQYDDGKMDGFYETNDGFAGESVPNPPIDARDGARALTYYDERDIPFYYALAKTFAIGDHYHAAILGPTWPNRMYLYGASSFGLTYNDFPAPPLASHFPDDDTSILDELEKRHVSWTMYSAGGAPGPAVLYATSIATRWGRKVNGSIDDFVAAAAANALPEVSFVDANYFETGKSDGNDEHPPADIQIGQAFVYRIVNAMLTSAAWTSSAILFTYDEHGGLYDHVPPPAACAPDALPPVQKDGTPAGFAFDRRGIRVPFVVVSPFAKAGYTSHAIYDHTSITRLLEAKYRVPALTARDANAEIPTDLFDFQNPPFVTPPHFDEPPIDQSELATCQAAFP